MKLLLLVAAVSSGSTAPDLCASIDTVHDGAYEHSIASAVAENIGAESASILQVFRYQGWSIVLAEAPEADNAFVFYSGEPTSSRAVAIWGGAAASFEEQAINDWALENAPGIPKQLARCFSWYVTHGRQL